jgi:hypothetical protein
MADDARLSITTDSPEVAKLFIVHRIASAAVLDAKSSKPDLRKYLATLEKAYQGISAATTPPAPLAKKS